MKKSGAKAVILDHDGVLGPNLSPEPDSTGKAFISDCLSVFGSGKVFILSNTKKMKEARRRFYSGSQMNGVTFIEASAKPSLEGLYVAEQKSGVNAKEIAVVDDGILTGILMAIDGGAVAVYVEREKMDESLTAKLARIFTIWPQKFILRFITLL